MLSCVTDCDQISQHPNNTSGSKQLFSFPKGERFLHYRKPYNNLISYEAPSAFKKTRVVGQTQGFGVSQRPELFP